MALYRNKRIFDVFVSSTWVDMVEHRKEAISAIRELGHRPTGMEFFNASQKDNKDFIRDCIKHCDMFLLMVGHNYGSLVGDKSFVEYEFELAKEFDKDCLMFVPADEDIRRLELHERLKDFRNRINQSGKIVCQYRLNALDNLRAAIVRSVDDLSQEMQDEKRGGWVRHEEVAPRSEVPPQILKSHVLKRVIEPLCTMDGIFHNLDECVLEKQAASQHLVHNINVALSAENGINRLFIDGGSTTYQFCISLKKYCKESTPFIHKGARKSLVIGTNSIFNFIELASSDSRRRYFHSLRLYPAPPVSTNFGKSFGTLNNVNDESEFSYAECNWRLSADAKAHLMHAVDEFTAWLNQGQGKNLTIMSAAGLDLDTLHPGPWVKHHTSMLQQQGIFRSKQPIALILDGTKWRKVRGKNEGYPVLFDGITWENVMSEQPLAVSICSTDSHVVLDFETYFEDKGFRVIHDVRPDTLGERDLMSYLAFNPHFLHLIVRQDTVPNSSAPLANPPLI